MVASVATRADGSVYTMHARERESRVIFRFGVRFSLPLCWLDPGTIEIHAELNRSSAGEGEAALRLPLLLWSRHACYPVSTRPESARDVAKP